MFTFRVSVILITVYFVHYQCRDLYEGRPKIKTLNGDLIIEPAVDKNIYLRTNGPKSTIFVQDFNLINFTSSGHLDPTSSNNVVWNNNEIRDVMQRLNRLERQNVQPSGDILLNFTLLSRRLNRQTTIITSLRQQIVDWSRDRCATRPCRNGGTCLSLAHEYHCLCPSNWEGQDCDVDVNECRNFAGTDLGCQNGAECINRPGTYECQCRNGWFGVHCTRKTKDCSGGNYEMCGHGTCIPVPSGEGIACMCDQGWKSNGTHVACLTDVDECESSQYRCSVNPKVECINVPGSFRCGQCPLGYEGDGYICSDIDECITVPNGGCSTSPMVSCHNTIGSRMCGPCPSGYQGDGITCTWRGSCSINRGGCHPSAECIDNTGSGQTAQCICPPGMEGDGFGLQGCFVSNDSRGCESNPCGIHGQCHPLRTGYTCICSRGYGGTFCDKVADYCARSPCQNGGSCRPDESVARGFRCECTAQYAGDLCQIASRSCGGILQNEEGSIVYPLTNTTYNHNIKCAWVIQTSRDKVLNITFTKFNLEEAPECIYDFLQIHDGRNPAAHLIGRFCGSNLPKGGNFISTNNNLYLWFRTDQSQAYEGFALHWTSVTPVCGGEIDASTQGNVESPGSPGNYPPNRDCYWHILAPLGKRIQLHFFTLDIEIHETCDFDFLAIYDGASTLDPLLGKFCNTTHPGRLESSGSEVMIYFHSDEMKSGKGFQISYVPIEGIPGCGGLFTLDRGDIVSPSFGGKYMNNLVCEYKIKVSVDSKIRLNFTYFKLESSIRCQYDYLKIYDGPSSDSKLVGKFCGTRSPQYYISSSNTLFIVFKSDSSSTNEGFRLTYETLCQQTIIGESGIVKTPGYPFNYPEGIVCEYILGTSVGKAIRLTFQDFDIEDTTEDNCTFDYLEVRDGVHSNATLLGKYCGGADHIPPVRTSSHNFMYLKLVSDPSLTGTGFYANFTSIDIHCGGIYRENTGVISFPYDEGTLYENNENCTWMLVAPEGMQILVTWNRLDIEKTPNCGSDYLELVEITENESYKIGKYCGNKKPPAITIPSNQVRMNFVSDFSIKSGGFSLSYRFVDEKSHCGGTFMRTHGFINSPGWPNKYEMNRDCTWIIQAPVGQQIKLNISQFDLELPIRSKCDYGDYLEIRNGHTANSPLIGKFCGKIPTKSLVSFANTLFLRFHSDSLISKKGFHIEFESAATGCGGTLNTPTGSIISPGYPENYDTNAECFYKIVTSSGTRIRISFKEMDLEQTVDCRDDYVEIFDGRDENANSLGKYCTMLPDMNNIQTTSNYAYIKFRSDFFIGGRGFVLDYFSICKNNVSGLHGIIESPGYPDQYPLRLDCLFFINVPKGNKINITFTHFDIYQMPYRPWWHQRPIVFGRYGPSSPLRLPTVATATTNCISDYLQIKETTETSFRDRQCGNNLPTNLSKFTSKTNSLQIKFVTGEFYTATGFRLEWARFGCGGFINKKFGTISLDRSLVTSEELECEWVIEGPPGKRITLQILDAYMTDNLNCTTDAIELYNGRYGNAPLITKICHKDIARLQSSSNIMTVRFVKRSNLRDVSFNIHFDAFSTGCGGMIESRSGIIHSDNYPTKNYENNINCVWTIHVPQHHRIELNFMSFDLYSNDEDDCGDKLKIFDGNHYILNSNYSYLMCPSSKIREIVSKSNILGLEFLTNNVGAAKGFKVNFTMTCGGIIETLYDGILTNDQSANYFDINCTWTIIAPSPDQKISLTLTHIAIPKDTDVITNRNCPLYYLKVLDGSDEKAPLLGEYCGKKVPPMIVSRGSAITVQLGAYNKQTVRGTFSAHYTTVSSACGGSLSSEEGSIASPNYPMSYPVKVDCEWTLTTSPGNKVYINFEQFNIEYSEDCNEDYLEVRENNGGGKLLGLYCGNEIPTNTSSANKLYIKFHADNKGSGRGFVMHYGFSHGNEINDQETGEIASPLYPHKYTESGDFSWRIITKRKTTITVVVDVLEIPVNGDLCYNSLIIYDGYDLGAPVLDKVCGVAQETKIYHTTSNAVFIRLNLDDNVRGSLFHLNFASSDKDANTGSNEQKRNCGFNETKIMNPSETLTFTSPNFPNQYENGLNCQWIFKATPGHHLSLEFQEILLESTPSCFADYISIYSAENIGEWKPIKESVCHSNYVHQISNSSSYLKVEFHTDVSVQQKGFRAIVRALCGGFIKDSSGVIGPSWSDIHDSISYKLTCEWTIKVRPSRMISFNFEHFNITNTQDNCETFVTIRNGDSSEAPLLGSGKYCGYSHENMSAMVSSSNVIFVSYSTLVYGRDQQFLNFRLRFEEKNYECGVSSKLDENHKWEIFSTPNYPVAPFPYADCIWIFTGPPGEILRLDFLERFDLDNTDYNCDSEFVEIKDGSTELSRTIDKICGRNKPGTIKTSGNVIYINYFSEMPEPGNGFKANVTIDTCGGTIRASAGELVSPGYPHMQHFPSGTVCEWKIIGPSLRVLNIKTQDVDLPLPEAQCGVKVSIEEIVNTSPSVISNMCGDEVHEASVVQLSSNEAIIKLSVGVISSYSSVSESRGFRFTFNSSRSECGGKLTSTEGFFTTPGYPRETKIRYCRWTITVPDSSRKIRLELLDTDRMSHTIGIFNDLYYKSPIVILRPGQNISETTSVFESSGNVLTIYLFLNQIHNSQHRFKAKFTSDEEALCGGKLNGITGQLKSPSIDRSYFCKWNFHYETEYVVDNNFTNYKTLSLHVRTNSSKVRSGNKCWAADSQISLSFVSTLDYPIMRTICGNTDTTISIPSTTLDITAVTNNANTFEFDIYWKLQSCGGIVRVSTEPVNVINVSDNFNETIDCVWLVTIPTSRRVEIKLAGEFFLDCENENITVREGVHQTAHTIGEYCKTKTQDQIITASYRTLLVHYHSKTKPSTKIKLIVRVTNSVCGGSLTANDRLIESPNFPHAYDSNTECTWEIKIRLGNRIHLEFIERFAIEKKENCTKDSITIYDWRNNSYSEIAKLCGRDMPPQFNSTSNKMKVVFRSDSEINLDGFRAFLTSLCGGQFTATEETQYIYSPGYPSYYSSSLNCIYEIRSSELILLKFDDFELEGTYPDCLYDNVTISASANYNYIMAIYCGTEIPPALKKYKEISIAFKTDSYSSRHGFKISYSTYKCGGSIKGPQLFNFGSDDYENDMNCTWKIEAPLNKHVILKFFNIDMEGSYSCSTDYISVFEGLFIEDDNRLASLCGNINSSLVLRSIGNTMLVQIITDSSITAKGFKAEILFSYSESVGCGGTINLTATPHLLTSPLINGNKVYENNLDCHWSVYAPVDYNIKIEFNSFHIAPCSGVNQTALGINKCDCDYVEIKDGLNPDDLLIDKFCGHTMPPEIISSENKISIRLFTDNSDNSAGFSATLSLQRSACGQTQYLATKDMIKVKSPGYDLGVIPRGIHCVYHISKSGYQTVRLTIKNLDIRPGEPDESKCNKDKLSISENFRNRNITVGKDYVINGKQRESYLPFSFNTFQKPDVFSFCGKKQYLDFYFENTISIQFQTSADSDSKIYKGIEIEVQECGFCGRNYTEVQGRIKIYQEPDSIKKYCFTTITVPENYSVSIYFLSFSSNYYDDDSFLDIYDGNTTNAMRLLRMNTSISDNFPVFFSGRYVLLHYHNEVSFDITYTSSDKGKGCGGKLNNDLGVFTSPMYPDNYRKRGSCEWEVETPVGTKVQLHFFVFDMGVACYENYLQLVDRRGNVISNFCEEAPADYTSPDNYVKVVFTTTMNNGGTGWVAEFVASL